MLTILVSIGCIIAGYKAIGKGLVLGSTFSVINFVLMGETLSAKLNHTKKATFFVAIGSIFFRYTLLAAPLIIGLQFEQINFFSVVTGIFSVQLIILVDHLANHISSVLRKKSRNNL